MREMTLKTSSEWVLELGRALVPVIAEYGTCTGGRVHRGNHRIPLASFRYRGNSTSFPEWADQVRRGVERIPLAAVLGDESASFPEWRDTVVARLRATEWFRHYDFFEDMYEVLPCFVDELAETENVEEFAAVWSVICQVAGIDQVELDLTIAGSAAK